MFYSHANMLEAKKLPGIFYDYIFRKKRAMEIFKSEIKNYFGEANIANVIDFNLARNAFEHIALTLNIKKILMPAFLCPVFEDVLLRRKIKPVFVDIDIESLNIDVEKAQEVMDKSIDAILAVHTFGNACDLSALLELKEDYNAFLIEDCAHAFGARYKNKLLGTFGDAAIFSLYKYFPTIAGGFLLSKHEISEGEYERDAFGLKTILRLFYMLSIFHPAIFRVKEIFKSSRAVQSYASTRKEEIKRGSYIDIIIFNHFFKNIDKEIAGRNKVAKAFDARIDSKVSKQKIMKDAVSSRQSYAILINASEKREQIIKNLWRKGILAEKTWHDTIVLSEKIIEVFKIKPEDYPHAISAAQRIITLPIKADYSKRDIEFIADSVNKELLKI